MNKFIISCLVFAFSTSIIFANIFRILPNSAIDISQYSDKTITELIFLRNSIFANYGYIFTSKILSDYFNTQKWYKPNYRFRLSDLSSVDSNNVNSLLILEDIKFNEYLKNFDRKGRIEFYSKLIPSKNLDVKLVDQMIHFYNSNNLNIPLKVPKYLVLNYESDMDPIEIQDKISKRHDFTYYEVIYSSNIKYKIIKIHYVDFSSGDLDLDTYYIDTDKIVLFSSNINGTTLGHEWKYQYLNNKFAWIQFTLFSCGEKTATTQYFFNP